MNGTIGANMNFSSYIQTCGMTWIQLVDLANELQATLQLSGLIKGG